MRLYPISIIVLLIPLFREHSPIVKNSHRTNEESHYTMNSRIQIKIGHQTFSATLANNGSANAFTAMLPLSVTMIELNSNEKYYEFSSILPSNASNPGTINSGDLMLWGSNTLVLFYKTFPTSYRYTRIGKIENPTKLAAALGSGNVEVTYNWSKCSIAKSLQLNRFRKKHTLYTITRIG